MIEYMDRLRKDGFTFRPTTDEWHPNFPDNLVAVKVVERISYSKSPNRPPNEYAVWVTGADDTAMEFITPDKEVADRVFKELPSIITKSHLRSIGFRNG